MAKDQTPRHASTIVLLRQTDDGLQTLLLRRHRASGFMAGAFVFPGGKLDDADASPEVLERIDEAAREDARAALNPTPGIELSDAQKIGLFVAAARETFEEAGALFARRRDGQNLKLVDLAEWRRRINAGDADFSSMLAAEDLEIDLSSIHYFAHWVTPSAERRRFDTRFFVALVPEGQSPSFDQRETVEERWLSPTDALLEHQSGAIFLPPPTQRTLEELGDALRFDQVVEIAARRRARIQPIMPKVTAVDGDITILLPWDPLYDETEGASMEAADPEPEAGRPSRIRVIPPGS